MAVYIIYTYVHTDYIHTAQGRQTRVHSVRHTGLHTCTPTMLPTGPGMAMCRAHWQRHTMRESRTLFPRVGFRNLHQSKLGCFQSHTIYTVGAGQRQPVGARCAGRDIPRGLPGRGMSHSDTCCGLGLEDRVYPQSHSFWAPVRSGP